MFDVSKTQPSRMASSDAIEPASSAARRRWCGHHRTDRTALWSPKTLGSRRRRDATEPVSSRAVAMWWATQMSTMR